MLLNACGLLIGEIPGPIDPLADADGGTSSSDDAGVNSTVDNVDNTAGGATDASVEPSVATTDTIAPESEGTSTPSEDTMAWEDMASTDVETLPDASLGAPGDSGDVTKDSESDNTTTEDTGSDPCDRDEDGVESEVCGGEDCDDDDPDVHPGQVRYFEVRSERVGFDYDCSGLIDRDPSEPGLSCSLELAQCDAEAQGFMGEPLPACGEQGDWGQCVSEDVVGLPGMCTAQKLEDRRAGCR